MHRFSPGTVVSFHSQNKFKIDFIFFCDENLAKHIHGPLNLMAFWKIL